MSIIAPDRVLQTTVTAGTADYTLLPATAGFRGFSSAYSNGARVPYCASDNISGYEIGIGTFVTGSPDQIIRNVPLLSSNSNSKVSWIGSTKQIFAWDTSGSVYVSSFSSSGVTVGLGDWGTAFIFTGSSIGAATLPAISSVPRGFSVRVKNSGTAPCNITPNVVDQIESMGAGVSYQLNPGGWTTVATDLTVWRQVDAVAISPDPGTFTLHRVTTGTSDSLSSLTAPRTQIAWESASVLPKSQSIPAANSFPSYEVDLADLVGNANTYPITITPLGGTIALQSSITLQSPGGNITLRAHGPLNNWIIR